MTYRDSGMDVESTRYSWDRLLQTGSTKRDSTIPQALGRGYLDRLQVL